MGGFFLGGLTDARIFAGQGVVEITVCALTGLFGGASMGRANGKGGGRNSNMAQLQGRQTFVEVNLWTFIAAFEACRFKPTLETLEQ